MERKEESKENLSAAFYVEEMKKKVISKEKGAAQMYTKWPGQKLGP